MCEGARFRFFMTIIVKASMDRTRLTSAHSSLLAAVNFMNACITDTNENGCASIIPVVEQKVDEKRTLITSILSGLVLKDPASIVSQYILPSQQDFSTIHERRKNIHVGNYVGNVMAYVYLLSETINGQDLLGYEQLSYLPCTDPLYRLVYSIERMVYYSIKIFPATVIQCCMILTANPTGILHTGCDEKIVDRRVDWAYFQSIPGNNVEGRIPSSIICPYCLGSPIKYSYYKRGPHRSTKKHLRNKENTLEIGNYFRYLFQLWRI